MKKKNIARIIIYPMMIIVPILILIPQVSTRHHHEIDEQLKNTIMTEYFRHLKMVNGSRVVRPMPWIEITGGRYTDRRYQPAIYFDLSGQDMRVMTGENSWIVYKIHLSSGKLKSVFVEESRYPSKNQSANQLD